MLRLLAYLYGRVTKLRNRLYDRGVFETFDLGALTVSIGNITTGGTGKTPLAAYVAGILADRGEKVCILTRGYGRREPNKRVLVSDGESVLVDAPTGGDEAVELAHKLLDKNVIVIADADRVAAAEWAKRKFGVTAFVLDDGFQHRRVRRDVDIVCVDATDPCGGGRMLPVGRLREYLCGLARADVIVITRSDLVKDISDLRSRLSVLNSTAAVFTSSTAVRTIAPLLDDAQPTLDMASRHAFAFCGLGNPDGFVRALERCGWTVVGRRDLRDHHYYSQADIDEITKDAHEAGAETLVTTSKDAVKLLKLHFEIPCLVVEIEARLDRPEEFASLL